MTMTTALPPGPSTLPIIQGLRFAYRPAAFLEDCARRFGETFLLRMPVGVPFVMFSNPSAIREIFTAGDDDLRAGEANQVLRPLLGDHSLLSLDGPRHTRERRLMLPPFHGERMLAYGAAMQDVTERAVGRWPLGRPFPVQPEMQAITLEVILRTVFGVTDDETLQPLRAKLRRLLDRVVNPIWLLPVLQKDLGRFSPGGWFARLKREIDGLLYREFARRRAAGPGGDDVLSMLITARDEDGHPMTDAELRDEMVTLLAAGHDTTATALSWAFHQLLERPDVLDELRAELAGVARDGAVPPAAIPRLEYLDATVKETLRLRPVVPEVGRHLSRPMRIGGWDLPAGVAAAPAIYLTHRRPDVWPDPERFHPARFVGLRPSPYEFLPFGGGTRRCLGMAFALHELKVVLATVLSRVELRPAPGYRMRMVRRAITLAPSEGMPLVVERRVA
jgi:cytochrome P450